MTRLILFAFFQTTVTVPHSHPAPLPLPVVGGSQPTLGLKALPPKPSLKISRVSQGKHLFPPPRYQLWEGASQHSGSRHCLLNLVSRSLASVKVSTCSSCPVTSQPTVGLKALPPKPSLKISRVSQGKHLFPPPRYQLWEGASQMLGSRHCLLNLVSRSLASVKVSTCLSGPVTSCKRKPANCWAQGSAP